VKEIISYILNKPKTKETRNVVELLKDFFDGNKPYTVGLLIKEKMLNLPGKVTEPLLKSLK